MSEQTHLGILKFYDPIKKYGFIHKPPNHNFFFRANGLAKETRKYPYYLVNGIEVSFQIINISKDQSKYHKRDKHELHATNIKFLYG